MGESHFLSSSKKPLLQNPNFFSHYVTMSSFLLFIKWTEEREGEDMVIKLSSKKSGRCVALGVVKGLLVIVTGCRGQRESAGKTNGASANLSRGILAFHLSSWSFSTSDLESLHFIVVLLLGGLARARLVGHHHCFLEGLSKSPRSSHNTRGLWH